MDKYQNFFYREYHLRYLYKSKKYHKIIECIGRISECLSRCYYFYSRTEEIEYIDLFIDIHAKNICNTRNYYGLTDFYYNKIFNQCGENLNMCSDFDLHYGILSKDKYFRQSLHYLFRLSVKEELYVTHVDLLSHKKYNFRSIFDNIEEFTESKFYWVVQNSKDYCFFSPSDCELVLDVHCDNKLSGMYAFFLNINTYNFDIKKTMDYFVNQILIARSTYHLINKSMMSNDEKEILEKIENQAKGSLVKTDGFQNRLLGLILWDYKNLKNQNLKDAFLDIANTSVNYPKMKQCDYYKINNANCDTCFDLKKCFKYIELLYKIANNSINEGLVASSNQR